MRAIQATALTVPAAPSRAGAAVPAAAAATRAATAGGRRRYRPRPAQKTSSARAMARPGTPKATRGP